MLYSVHVIIYNHVLYCLFTIPKLSVTGLYLLLVISIIYFKCVLVVYVLASAFNKQF